MHHPLLGMPPDRRRRAMLALTALTLGLAGWLRAVDGRLRGPGSEGGIVGFEFCRQVGDCAAQLAAIEGRGAAASLGFSLGLDYAFLAVYSTTLAAALAFSSDRVGRKRGPKFAGVRRAGLALAWLPWAAAALDAVENAALWQMASGAVESPWPALAFGCAAAKFALLGVGLLGLLGLALAGAR